jgi:hypothetical protein
MCCGARPSVVLLLSLADAGNLAKPTSRRGVDAGGQGSAQLAPQGLPKDASDA